ncbi:hypothetical protein Q8A64_05025 [Oxalobacteraceae bacterium R-40]|uniref:PsiF repeat-containing protein n=1 Tax=Keguizhuia sedimenti TaxID=3064264 RepID=A0ABU1BL84_9BURK|nr:hypothetical protein [Oxalobacteraceae bacterium R-40]
MIKRVLAIVFAIFPLFFNFANAADDAKGDVAACEKNAGGRSGGERKAFIEGCVKVKSDARKAAAEASRKKAANDSCTKDAGNKQGTERKAFIDGCVNAKEDAYMRSLQASKPKSALDICRKEAESKNESERKSFIDGCLKAKETARLEAERRQADTSNCTKAAGSRKGEELKAFVAGCLKGKNAEVARQNEIRKKAAEASKKPDPRKMKDPCYAKEFKSGEEQEQLAKRCLMKRMGERNRNNGGDH